MRESQFLEQFPAATIETHCWQWQTLPFFPVWITVLSLYSNYYSPTCMPPGGPLTWLRRGRCFPPPLHLGDRQAGLGTEALGSLWSRTRMLPGLLMLCEDPERELGQMDRMSCVNGLETTRTLSVLAHSIILSNVCHETLVPMWCDWKCGKYCSLGELSNGTLNTHIICNGHG